MKYFTMIYGIINARTGKAKITQAVYPSPIIAKKNGDISLIGSGGFPVGIFPDATYDEHEFYIESGDRFIIFSDGITECLNNKKKAFSLERLLKIIKNTDGCPLHGLITDLEKKLNDWNGGKELDDDISLLAFKMK